MVIAIFNKCSLDEKPVLQRLMPLEDFMKRQPKALGSRSGPGEYGLVEMKGEGLTGAFRRTRVYIGLNKDNIRQLRRRGLSF
jgi:hypothetical protein